MATFANLMVDESVYESCGYVSGSFAPHAHVFMRRQNSWRYADDEMGSYQSGEWHVDMPSDALAKLIVLNGNPRRCRMPHCARSMYTLAVAEARRHRHCFASSHIIVLFH